MERGLRALKRWKQSQSEEKSAVGNFPTHMLKRVGNSPTMAVPRTAKTEGRVGNFPTPFLRNGRNPSNLVVGDFPTHTAVPAGSANSLVPIGWRSEEHTSELQSLMRISYAVFCLTTKNNIYKIITDKNNTRNDE